MMFFPHPPLLQLILLQAFAHAYFIQYMNRTTRDKGIRVGGGGGGGGGSTCYVLSY